MKKLMYIGLFLMITFSAFGWPHRINWGLPFLPMGIINDNFDEIFSRADTDSARIDGVVASDLLKVSLADSTGADAPGTYVTGHDNIAALALKANLASPTFTGTVTAPIISHTATVSERTILVTIDSTKLVGSAVGDLAHVDGAVLVAAPAAGYLLEFVSAVFIYDYSTAAFGGGADDVVVQVGASGSQVTVSSAITGANLLEASGDKILRLGSIATELVPAAAGAISIQGTLLTNPGTAAGVLRVHLTYRIHTTGL